MKTSQVVYFRLFNMPCCHFLMCWVNPRLPTYCPECGTKVYMDLKTGLCTVYRDDKATLRIDEKFSLPVEVDK